MMPCRSSMVTVPVCTTDWPAKSLLVGTSVQVPFMARWSAANGTSVQVPFMARWSAAMAEHAKSKVVKTAAAMVVEYVLMITFQELLFSTEADLRNTAYAARFEWPALTANLLSWWMASISRGPSGSQPRRLYCLRPF